MLMLLMILAFVLMVLPLAFLSFNVTNWMRDPAKTSEPKNVTVFKKTLTIFIAISFLFLIAWALYYNFSQQEFERQRVAETPHTAHILNYQISFPKKVPPGYQGGYVNLSYSNDWHTDKQGDEGCTRFAYWEIWRGSPCLGGMQFMVNEKARPGIMPSEWLSPDGARKMVRTAAGTKEFAGLKFDITRWIGELYEPQDTLAASEKTHYPGGEEKYLPEHGTKISGVDYIAHENGKVIALRAYNLGDDNAAILQIEAVLNTLHKIKMESNPAGKDSTSVSVKGNVEIGQAGQDKNFVDPYAELIEP